MQASVRSVEDNLEGSVNTAVSKLKGACRTSAKGAVENSTRHLLQRNTASIVDRLYRIAQHIALVAEENS
jgi:hypothetical protein